MSVPLVLVPGLLTDADLFAPQVEALAPATPADVSVADVSGGGSMAAMAAAVLAVAPPRFALAGLSMGGYVSFEILRRSPERVAGLALLDTSARPDTREVSERRRRLVRLAQERGAVAAVDELWPVLVHPDRHQDGTLRATVRGMAERLGADVFARQQDAIMARPDSRPHLAAVHVPALVLCGREDAITPLEVHEEMAAALPEVELVVVDRCGHLSTLERPDEVSAALRRWWRRLS